MSLGCSATNCASSCRRSCVGAEERSAWSSVGSCRLGCTNAQSSQTGRLLRCSNSDWDGQRTKRNLRTKVSKPPKPTILDLSHRPHHRRLPRQRFSAMRGYGTEEGGELTIPQAEATRSHYVRFSSHSDRIDAAPRNAALCQQRKWPASFHHLDGDGEHPGRQGDGWV